MQTKLAYADEINVFRRTLLYAGPPNSSRRYDVEGPGQTVGARALIYLRRRDGAGAGAFRKFVNDQFAPALAGTGVLKELRTQTFLPWTKKLWDTPDVAHDNPHDQHFHASVGLGFTDTAARDAFFTGRVIEDLSNRMAPIKSPRSTPTMSPPPSPTSRTARSSRATRSERRADGNRGRRSARLSIRLRLPGSPRAPVAA
ncbi:hypothetical protein ACFW91_07475 [Streptomyces asoensis]|uniref:hypothetical protein n=1 Tax=Streptomyces asoensis TaxID=249586 RepID=UPI0036AC9E0F